MSRNLTWSDRVEEWQAKKHPKAESIFRLITLTKTLQIINSRMSCPTYIAPSTEMVIRSCFPKIVTRPERLLLHRPMMWPSLSGGIGLIKAHLSVVHAARTQLPKLNARLRFTPVTRPRLAPCLTLPSAVRLTRWTGAQDIAFILVWDVDLGRQSSCHPSA
jgi:hypothetical protein